MIEVIEFKGEFYPKFQSSGNAARFILPFAQEVCKGMGLDIGYNKPEWKFPGATGIDDHKLLLDGGEERISTFHHALNVPPNRPDGWDYIFSSHCLEHLPNWVDALDHWYDNLIKGGILFLYLPDPSQKYWLPWNNRKHIHMLRPMDVADYLDDKGYQKVFVSGVDLNNSYAVIAEK